MWNTSVLCLLHVLFCYYYNKKSNCVWCGSFAELCCGNTAAAVTTNIFFSLSQNQRTYNMVILHLLCFVNPKTCYCCCCAPAFFSSKAMTTATHRHWERINLRLEGSSSNLESWKLRNGANGQRWWTKPLKWALTKKSCARVLFEPQRS